MPCCNCNPIFFRGKDETINQTLNLSVTALSPIATILTLVIAILLFNKYGIESSLMEKSSSKVFELLEKIKETSFAISSERCYFQITMSDPFKYSKFIERFYEENLVFSENYVNDLNELFKISYNPFIPPSISKKMENIQFAVLAFDIDDKNINKYSKVQVIGSEKIQNLRFARFNSQDLTVFEFLKILDEISTEIKQWIQSNSAIAIDLNL